MSKRRKAKIEKPKLSKDEQERVDKFVEYLFLGFIVLAIVCTIIVYSSNSSGISEGYVNMVSVEGYYENSFRDFKTKDVTRFNYEYDGLEYEIYVPDEMINDRSGKKYPVVFFANSDEFKCKDIKPILKHMASYGFVAVGNNGENYNGDDLKKAFDHMKMLNDTDMDSLFYQSIDEQRIGLYGTYDGAVNAVKLYEKLDDNSFRINFLVLSCLPKEEALEKLQLEKYDLSRVYSNTFVISTDNSKMKNVLDADDTFNKLEHALTKIKATRNNIKLSSMPEFQDGYVTGYFMCFMQNDENARKMFYDTDEEAELKTFSGEWYNVEIKI